MRKRLLINLNIIFKPRLYAPAPRFQFYVNYIACKWSGLFEMLWKKRPVSFFGSFSFAPLKNVRYWSRWGNQKDFRRNSRIQKLLGAENRIGIKEIAAISF